LDKENFEQIELIYKKYKPALMYYCMQFVRNQEDALEIVHDVFVAVWEKRDVLEINLELRPYLYRAVHNKSINFIQKRKLQMQEVEETPDMASQLADPFQILQHKQIEKSVIQLIDKLPPRCKQVFVLSRKEGLSYKEIAAILDVSPKTVENQISIAIKFIKKGLEEKHDLGLSDGNVLSIITWVFSGFNVFETLSTCTNTIYS
jgi:RNA polymerase sigma-70 factor (ECF subfamily)